jgi:transglutaminase-like putative cysteine protease
MKIALEHRTSYRFGRPIAIGPHVIRLRPAPHARTPIESYSLTIAPSDNLINWQQDPFGNYLARVLFPTKAGELMITVGLIADMKVINPFDFFIENYAESYPFSYPTELAADLKPYLDIPDSAHGPLLDGWVASSATPPPDGQPTVEFLSTLNQAIFRDVAYSARMEPGVHPPDETLARRIGSCRDSAWLLVTALRQCGLAARFVSGYLVQLAPDQPSPHGPSGPTSDFTDLHAWAEVYIPGAGWIGLDPTSALFAGEGHIPLAATPHPASAAPISGATEPSVTTMEFVNTVRRLQGPPRTTLPYSAAQLDQIQQLGEAVDKRLQAAGLELTLSEQLAFSSAEDSASALSAVNLNPTSGWADFSEEIQTAYRIASEQRLAGEIFALDGRHGSTGSNHLTLGGTEPVRSPFLQRPDLLISMITFWQHHPALSYLFSGRFVGPSGEAPRVDEGLPETPYELEISFAEIEELTETDDRPTMVYRALRNLLTDIAGNISRAEFCIDKLCNPDSTQGIHGSLQLRGFEMPPHPDMALVQALLVRALIARFAAERYSAPLVRWGSALHERFLLPHFVQTDVAEVVADLRAHGFEFELSWLGPFVEFRFPQIGLTNISDVQLELRSAIEPWYLLGEQAAADGPVRYVDSATERLQVAMSGFVPERQLLTCNGRAVPLTATGTPGSYVAGVRYTAWKPPSSLHPSLEVNSPLIFDLIDRASRVSLGGATYHVVDAGGRSYDRPPVNAAEAEARRHTRFEAMGHTAGEIDIEALDEQLITRSAGNDDYPLTLDLRRRVL